MKIVAVFVMLVMSSQLKAQSESPDHLKQCLANVDDAWFYANETATTLEFNNSASTLDDVRSYCFEALTTMDSVDLKLQLAIYSATDAAFAAKDKGDTSLSSTLQQQKPNLQAASKSIAESRKYLSSVLDETDLTAINQKLFDTIEHLNDCRQSIRDFQRNLKKTTKKAK